MQNTQDSVQSQRVSVENTHKSVSREVILLRKNKDVNTVENLGGSKFNGRKNFFLF